jgi:hypothetical protein
MRPTKNVRALETRQSFCPLALTATWLSARLQRANFINAISPDVTRLATFSWPLRGLSDELPNCFLNPQSEIRIPQLPGVGARMLTSNSFSVENNRKNF